MPNSSSIFTSVASEYRGGGCVKCCSGTKLQQVERLLGYFPDIVDTGFTSHMEEELDEISSGSRNVGAGDSRVLLSV